MSEAQTARHWGERLQGIGRRPIYLLLAAALIWQLLKPYYFPMIVSPPARGVFEAVEAVPKGKIIVLCADWDVGTAGENDPQTTALIAHFFRERKPFAILSLVPQGATLAGRIAQRLAPQYRANYGTDWVNWGYKYGFENFLISWVKNIPKAIEADQRGTPITEVPMMKGVKDYQQVGLVIDVTGSAGVLETWVQFVQGPYGVPFAMALTGVMGPESYPFLDTGQLKGLLTGLKGAAEYEKLVGRPGKATEEMPAQSAAHLFIILLILAGNLGYFAARRSERRGGNARA